MDQSAVDALIDQPDPAMWFHRPFRSDEWLPYAPGHRS